MRMGNTIVAARALAPREYFFVPSINTSKKEISVTIVVITSSKLNPPHFTM
jgi:hypothetical protein